MRRKEEGTFRYVRYRHSDDVITNTTHNWYLKQLLCCVLLLTISP